MSEVFDCTTPEGLAAGIEAAARAVQSGQVVVLPTDTVYGIGCDAFDASAVTAVLAARMWPTLQLCFAAMVIAIVLGVPLGFVAALKPGSLIDTLSMVGAVSGLSLPKFWLGLLLMYLFALKLGWLPSFGYGDGAYTATVTAGEIAFQAETRSEKHGRLLWRGTVRGPRLDGSLAMVRDGVAVGEKWILAGER